MKTTPALLIVTADDFPVGSVASAACDKLVADAGTGRHQYGGPHYPGHHVVFDKRRLKKSQRATEALVNLYIP